MILGRVDPFAADLPVYHPKRLTFKTLSICDRIVSRAFYSRCAFTPLTEQAINSDAADRLSDSMSATARHCECLIKYIAHTENTGGGIVEIGALRGETTRRLAMSTTRVVTAVDQYPKCWPPAAKNLEEFQRSAATLPNVRLFRETSVAASRRWPDEEKVGLLFIDGEHDFINTLSDFYAWLPKMHPDGYVAFHDVDHPRFPGTRVAVKYLLSKNVVTLVEHIFNLVVVRVNRPDQAPAAADQAAAVADR